VPSSGVGGFLIENADGPSEVPVSTTLSASIGLVVCGVIGLLTTRARPSPQPLRRAAALELVTAPFSAAALTVCLRFACPLYVNGPEAGCDFREVDVLGGWISGVVAAFAFDTIYLAAVLFVSALQADR
jgi:hypothetical protein